MCLCVSVFVVCVNEADAKSRDNDDDDDDVFVSAEDSAVSAVANVDSKRRSQSLSALSNDNCPSQPADVSALKCHFSALLVTVSRRQLSVVFFASAQLRGASGIIFLGGVTESI